MLSVPARDERHHAVRVAKERFPFGQSAVGETGTSPGARGQLHCDSVPVPDEQWKLLEHLGPGRVRYDVCRTASAYERQRADDEVPATGGSTRKTRFRSCRTVLDYAMRTLPRLSRRLGPYRRSRNARDGHRRHNGGKRPRTSPRHRNQRYARRSGVVPDRVPQRCRERR
jgi:hypothetical protein